MRYIKIVKPDVILTHKRAGSGAVLAAKLIGVPSVYVVRGYQHACFNAEKMRPDYGNVIRCKLAKCDVGNLSRCVRFAPNGHENFFCRTLEVLFSLYAYFVLRLRQFGMSKATVLVGVSDAVASSLKVIYPADSVVRIYNPMEIELFSGKQKKHDPAKRCFVYVGRFSRSKGIDVLLKAFKQLVSSYPNCRLAMVGDGPEMNNLKLLVREWELDQSVTFMGYLPFDKVLSFLEQNGFATVVPSLWEEAFGRVVIESMAMGIPVIASDIGGMSELISNGRNGILVEPGNFLALSEEMKKLVNNSELYEKMSTYDTEFVNQFASERIAATYAKLFQSII